MKTAFFLFGIFALLCSSSATSQQPAPSTSTAAPALTSAEQRIAGAKRQIELNPQKASAFSDLAYGYLRRARESADDQYLAAAQRALTQGLILDSKDFALGKAQVAILLAQHRPKDAKLRASELHLRTPDDVMIYGYLADAEIELGEYPEAEKSAQRMLNLLPNNVPGLLLGAKLRSLYGDSDGALELLNMAYTETSPAETEELAWIGNQIAQIYLASGNNTAAAAILGRASSLFPGSPYTLENQARLQLAQSHAVNAVSLLQQAAQQDSDPDATYQLAQAEMAANQPARAHADYASFQQRMTATANQSVQAQRDLILLYAGTPATAPVALTMAQAQIEARQDVWTLDAYAWASYTNGQYAQANSALQKALAVGVQDKQFFEHAAQIAKALHHDADQTRYTQLAAKLGGAENDAAQTATVATQQVATGIKPEARLDAPPLLSDSPALAAFSPVPASLLVPKTTDTDRVIRTAQARVARNPKDAPGFASLGAAYFQQARETGNVDSYQLAERSLTQSLDLVSNDFSADAALGTMAEVCMGEHRFADALNFAQKALALGSGDVSPFAIVGDAYADMGEYDEAAQAYARLTPREMTLSPRAAYARDSRLSYLKFIAGDTPGAIALMKTAVSEGTEAQLPAENLAWLYYELGEYFAQAGETTSADKAFYTALTVHPGDYRALAALGKLRANRGDLTGAVELYKRAIAIVPMPLFVAELGDLYVKMGNPVEANKQFRLVEYIGLLGSINQVLHNRDLALFYSDHDLKLPEALKLAQREFEVRHDIYTWDALAWALYKNGRAEEAAKASQQALRHGTHDSMLFFHAGVIAEKLGRRDQARSDFIQAIQTNPAFHVLYANEARQKLAGLEAPPMISKGKGDEVH